VSSTRAVFVISTSQSPREILEPTRSHIACGPHTHIIYASPTAELSPPLCAQGFTLRNGGYVIYFGAKRSTEATRQSERTMTTGGRQHFTQVYVLRIAHGPVGHMQAMDYSRVC